MKPLKTLLADRRVRAVLLLLAALLLLMAVKLVFFGDAADSGYEETASERRLRTLICRMEDVEACTVMITEEGDQAVSAVILFTGTDGILVRSRILSVAASALGIPASSVQVYPAEK